MGRFLIETHLRTGRPIKELAAAHEVSASWLFKLLRRYSLGGARGLVAALAAAPSIPHPDRWGRFEDEIVALVGTAAQFGREL